MVKNFLLMVMMTTAIADHAFAIGGSLGKLANDIKREAKSCVSGGCDVGKAIKNGVKDGVGDIAGEVADEAAEAVIKAADHIFDKQIDPLVERLNVIVKETISKGGEEVETRVNNIIDNAIEDIVFSFGPWFDEVIRVADQFSPEEIEEHLINTTFDRLDNLETRLFKHADELLSKIDIIVDGTLTKLDCIIDGTKDDVILLVREKYGNHFFPNPIDYCRRKTKTGTKFGSQLSNGEVYLINKCNIEREIDKAVSDDLSIDYILTKYGDLMNLAAEMQCIERRGLSEKYVKDWINYNRKAQIWLKYY